MRENETSNIDLQFAFPNNAGQVIAQHFAHDAANAKLSPKFQLYYLLRPFTPIWLRQKLQKSRGEAMTNVSSDWYIPKEFIQQFGSALREDCLNTPDASIVHPWPKPWHMAMSLTHDVETRDGVRMVDRIAKLEESYGFRSCWYFVPHKYKIDPKLIEDLKARGHEIGVHGYNHDGRLFSSKSIFDKRSGPIKKATDEFEASGFRAPMVHRNLDWISELGTDYDASCFDVDPYQAMAGGIGSIWPFLKRDMVELPYTMPQDHTLFVALEQKDIAIWKHKLEFLRRWNGMGMLITHPDYMATEARLDLYRQLLEHLHAQNDVWFALPKEISKWWRERSQSSVAEGALISGPAKKRGQVLRLIDLLQSSTQPIDGLSMTTNGSS